MTITPEQRQAIRQAGDAPVRLEDPETHEAYVILRADVYERLRQGGDGGRREGERPSAQPTDSDLSVAIPEGIRRAQDAFFRDLPDLLKNPKLRGKWVAYHGDEQVKIGRTQTEVIKECNRRGLTRDRYDVFVIEPQSREPEEVDYPSAWYDV